MAAAGTDFNSVRDLRTPEELPGMVERGIDLAFACKPDL